MKLCLEDKRWLMGQGKQAHKRGELPYRMSTARPREYYWLLGWWRREYALYGLQPDTSAEPTSEEIKSKQERGW